MPVTMYDGTDDETNQTEITLGCQFVRLPKKHLLKEVPDCSYSWF